MFSLPQENYLLVDVDMQLHVRTVSLFETLCDLQGFAERAKQKAVLNYHCECSRGLGPRFGLRLGLRLGLTFNCIQSFKSRLFEPLFLATFKVFFTVNEQ